MNEDYFLTVTFQDYYFNTRPAGCCARDGRAVECGGLENNHSKMYYCYKLKSLKDSKYYFGSTSDLEARIKKHNSGATASTRFRRPLILHYTEKFETKTDALAREKFFKSFEGRQWLYSNKII